MKAEFDEHGREMDTYTLQEQEETIENSKSELRKIYGELLSVENTGELEDRSTTLEWLLRTLKPM